MHRTLSGDCKVWGIITGRKRQPKYWLKVPWYQIHDDNVWRRSYHKRWFGGYFGKEASRFQNAGATFPKETWAVSAFTFALFLLIALWIFVASTRPKITFVTSLWKFEDTFETCTEEHGMYAAVNHWAGTFDEVVILADEIKICDALENLKLRNLKCFPHSCKHPTDDKPTVRCLLLTGIELSSYANIIFSNSDLIFNGVHDAITIAKKSFKEFAILGQRCDVDFKGFCKSKMAESSTSSFLNLHELGSQTGLLHDTYGIDYIVFGKSTPLPLEQMPDFLVGIWKWDNWMVDTMIKSGLNVIDGTQVIKAVHLQETLENHRGRSGSDHNKLAYIKYYNLTEPVHLLDDPFPVGLGTIDFCPFCIKSRKVVRRWCYLNLLHNVAGKQSLCDDP